ncbi:MAG: hypothetical protein Q7R60_00055 [bacterium]|nr:hypothetical protein [bacterium]
MRIKRTLLLILVALGLLFSSNNHAQAVSLNPEIGINPNLTQSFTTPVTITFDKATELVANQNFYQLLVFKSGTGSAGSWADACAGQISWTSQGSSSAKLTLIGYTNISSGGVGSGATAINRGGGGGISFVDSHNVGNAQYLTRYNVNVSFDQAYENAHLFYVLLHSSEALLNPSESTCDHDASAFVPKAIASVDNDNGTTPVTIDSPETVAGRLGTAQVEGFNIEFLSKLFSGSGEELKGTNFPVLGVILKSLLYIAGLLLLLSVIYAGIILIRSTSDEEAAVAKKNLVWSLTGAFIIVIANWLVDTVIKFIK